MFSTQFCPFSFRNQRMFCLESSLVKQGLINPNKLQISFTPKYILNKIYLKNAFTISLRITKCKIIMNISHATAIF